MRFLIVPLLLGLPLTAQAPPATASLATPSPVATTFKVLDQGLLQNAWFGADLEWKEHPKGFLDYFWMKPGLNLSGHSLRLMKWEVPAMLSPGRNHFDTTSASALGDLIRGDIEARFEALLNDKAKVSFYDGDLLLVGRVVDCKCFYCDPDNVPAEFRPDPNRAALKLMPSVTPHGSSHLVFDLKLADAKTGELLVAVHHRMSSQAQMDMSAHSWVPDLGRYLAKVAVH